MGNFQRRLRFSEKIQGEKGINVSLFNNFCGCSVDNFSHFNFYHFFTELEFRLLIETKLGRTDARTILGVSVGFKKYLVDHLTTGHLAF